VLVGRCPVLEPLIDEVAWVPFVGSRHFESLPMRLVVSPRPGGDDGRS
jgi:hypothetical protein